MTRSACAAFPFCVDEESHVLPAAAHDTGDLDLFLARIDGVQHRRCGGGVGAALRSEDALQASHGGRVGHVEMPAYSVGVRVASEQHVLSLTSVTRIAKIVGVPGTRLRAACQQMRSLATPTLCQESWCLAMLDGATIHAQNLGAESPATYVVTFDRIGRTHRPPVLRVRCATATDQDGRAPDELLAAISAYARRFCGSSDVSAAATVAGDEDGGPRGYVFVGGIRNAGNFTLERAA